MSREIKIFLQNEYQGTKIVELSDQKFELIICSNEMVNSFFQDENVNTYV